MGAVLALVAVPPLSMGCAWALAAIRDHGGGCRPCGRWPLRRRPSAGPGHVPEIRPTAPVS